MNTDDREKLVRDMKFETFIVFITSVPFILAAAIIIISTIKDETNNLKFEIAKLHAEIQQLKK